MQQAAQFPEVVPALGETPRFRRGDRVRIALRSPVGHYRVPLYVRGRTGTIETIIVPAALDNEEEGFGRNAGSRRHYYRIAIPLRKSPSRSVSCGRSTPARSPTGCASKCSRPGWRKPEPCRTRSTTTITPIRASPKTDRPAIMR